MDALTLGAACAVLVLVGAVLFVRHLGSRLVPPAAVTAPSDPLLGKVLGGHRLIQKLGAGAMGSVYRALPVDGGALSVAIKVVHPAVAQEPLFVERFEREARVGSELRHPALVRVQSWGQEADLRYLVMELVPGEPLRRRIRIGMPVDEAVGYLRQLLDGMRCAHASGCLHRDLKPGNILVTPNGRVWILDFGLARRPDFETLTGTGQVMGTAGYLAPEVLDGRRADERADQYALGLIAYEMLAGQNPFRGHLSGKAEGAAEPPSLVSVRADLPPGLGALVHRMIARQPEQRFADLEEALRELDRCLPVP